MKRFEKIITVLAPIFTVVWILALLVLYIIGVTRIPDEIDSYLACVIFLWPLFVILSISVYKNHGEDSIPIFCERQTEGKRIIIPLDYRIREMDGFIALIDEKEITRAILLQSDRLSHIILGIQRNDLSSVSSEITAPICCKYTVDGKTKKGYLVSSRSNGDILYAFIVGRGKKSKVFADRIFANP